MSVETDFIAHALAEYPRECCGVVIVVKGRKRYRACKNLAVTPTENFKIDPADLIAAEDAGEVIGIYHSHPDGSNRMSQADRVSMEASGLPWSIVAIGEDAQVSDVATYHPEGYVAPLVGRTWSHGTLDCYSLVRDFYARELGIPLSEYSREDNWWRNGQNLYVDNYLAEGFEEVQGPLKHGDLLVMQLDSTVPNHGAVYLEGGMILQHIARRMSSRDVYGDYFRDATVLRLRYKGVK